MLTAEQSARNTLPTERPVSFEIVANEAPLSRSFAVLLDCFAKAVPNAKVRKRILVDNAAKLYGF